MNFISELSNEDGKSTEFIKYFAKGTASQCLVPMSQDKYQGNILCENLSKGDIDLQLELPKLWSELVSKKE